LVQHCGVRSPGDAEVLKRRGSASSRLHRHFIRKRVAPHKSHTQTNATAVASQPVWVDLHLELHVRSQVQQQQRHRQGKQDVVDERTMLKHC
jgi:hypothetical protein